LECTLRPSLPKKRGAPGSCRQCMRRSSSFNAPARGSSRIGGLEYLSISKFALSAQKGTRMLKV
jgi:hypothetical protein